MRRHATLIVLGLAIAPNIARAEDWPARPITLVVPYAAGGPTDVVGRLFAQQMAHSLGRPVVVENIVGAGGMSGAGRVAQAAPDGYRALFGGSGNLVFNQILYKRPAFNSMADFTPVGLLTEQSLVLIARKDLPADNLSGFVRYLKDNSNASFGSAGVGSSTHLGCVMLNLAIGVEVTHVPYRGAVPAMQDLIGGRIDYYCDIIPTALSHIQAGTVKPIAFLGRTRSPTLPNLPTAAEQGIAGLDTANWYGLVLPKGAQASIVQKLNGAGVAALEAGSFRERLTALGIEAVASDRRSPDYLGRFLAEDIAKWTMPIKASGVTVD
jgi:tripartite-type tricarboxylate transporter receptor subunit TctC